MPLHVSINRLTMGLCNAAALLLFMAGCQTYNSHPMTQTDGTYVKLPNASVKAVVWGTRQESVQSLTTWLMKRGMTLVDDVKVNQMVSDIRTYQPVTTISNAEIFKMGKTVGAKQIVFVDTDVSTWPSSELEAFFGQNQNLYTASIFIRALDADSGEIQWSGKAFSMNKFTNLKEGIHQLTCHALATAWGLRPPGIAAAPNICPVGQNVMVSNDPVTTPANGSKTATNPSRTSSN
jgi:acylphosphatase